jgi:hypothetical protein
MDDVGELGEEALGIDPGAGKRLLDQELVKLAVDRKAVLFNETHV